MRLILRAELCIFASKASGRFFVQIGSLVRDLTYKNYKSDAEGISPSSKYLDFPVMNILWTSADAKVPKF